MRGVRLVNFRLPLFTWGEAGAAGSAWRGRGRCGCVLFKVKSVGRRLAAPARRRLDGRGYSRIGARPGTGFTRDVCRRERVNTRGAPAAAGLTVDATHRPGGAAPAAR